jgi:hypothetical protein
MNNRRRRGLPATLKPVKMATKKKPATPVKKKTGPPARETEKQKRERYNRRRREKRAAAKNDADPAFTVKLNLKPAPSLRLGLRSPNALTGISIAEMKEISDINQKTKEGRLLIAALAILISSKSVRISGKDVAGVKKTPFYFIDKVRELANEIYKNADSPGSFLHSIKVGPGCEELIKSGNYDRALLVDNDGNIFGVPTPDGKLEGFKFVVDSVKGLKLETSLNGSENLGWSKNPIDFASDFCRGLGFYPSDKQNEILREVVSTLKNRNDVTVERYSQQIVDAKNAVKIAEEKAASAFSQRKAQELILAGSYDALRLEPGGE